MPLIIPRELPAYRALSDENVFVMHRERAHSQDIRPLRILILNLMPTKIVTETQLARLLDWAAGNWPTQLYGSALLLGLGCLTVGLRLIIRTRRLSLTGAAPEAEADSPKQPAQLNPFSLFVMGVVFCLLELTSALPYFGFLALLAGYHLPFLLVLLFILLYTFIYCLPLMLLYFGYNRLHGTAAIHKLEQVLSKVSSYIIPGAVSLAGAALIWYGGPQLL